MEPLQKFVNILLHYAICVYLVLILGIMPFYSTDGYSRIGTDKSRFFHFVSLRVGSVAAAAAVLYLLILLIRQRKHVLKTIREHVSVTDFFAAGYGVVLILSYLLTDYRETALWGYAGWYMGFWPQMIFLLIYFLVSKAWKPGKWGLYLAMTVSAVVFLIGYVNRLGMDPLHMLLSGSDFISTIGNINWYCGYLVSVFFAGTALLWQYRGKITVKLLLLAAYGLTGFCTLITQGSDSGLVAFAAVFLAMLILSAKDGERMFLFVAELCLFSGSCLITWILRLAFPQETPQSFGLADFLSRDGWPFLLWGLSALALFVVFRRIHTHAYSVKRARMVSRTVVVTVVILCVALSGMILFNSLRPGILGPLSENPFFTYTVHWGSNRGATWQAGWRCFQEQNFLHKLFGVGPDSMGEYLYKGASPELTALVRDSFASAILTNAHNEWLTVLVDTGILGLAAFAGMMLSAIYRFFKKADSHPAACACGFCLLAYTVNNFFSFQQSMSTATIFVMFGMGEAFLRQKPEENAVSPRYTAKKKHRKGNKNRSRRRKENQK